ncbi:MAG TPA: DUF2461 domain-containing protein [Anaerolineae bacterium]|jgi:uncharacterized protein (TIGR02453 family)
MTNLKPLLDFLRELRTNNNKPWFEAHRTQYTEARGLFEDFVQDIIVGIDAFDPLPGVMAADCIFRINRDVRFSKDKSPYKDAMSASIGPGGRKSTRASYYLHVSPGHSMIAGGAHMPSKEQLASIRENLAAGAPGFHKLIAASDFRKYFGQVSGEKLKLAPKGYPKDHPQIEWLKYTSLTAAHNLSDDDLLARNAAANVVKACKALKPFLDWVSEVAGPMTEGSGR